LLDRINRRLVEKRLGSKDANVADKAMGGDGSLRESRSLLFSR